MDLSCEMLRLKASGGTTVSAEPCVNRIGGFWVIFVCGKSTPKITGTADIPIAPAIDSGKVSAVCRAIKPPCEKPPKTICEGEILYCLQI